MKEFLRAHWGKIALFVVSLLSGIIAIQQHSVMQSGGYADAGVGGLSLSEIIAGLTALGTAVSGIVLSFKRQAVTVVATEDPTDLLIALAALSVRTRDAQGIDIVKAAMTHWKVPA